MGWNIQNIFFFQKVTWIKARFLLRRLLWDAAFLLSWRFSAHESTFCDFYFTGRVFLSSLANNRGSFWCDLSSTCAALWSSLLVYLISLINSSQWSSPLTALLSAGFGVVSLPEAWVVWWKGLTAWRQTALTGKSGMIRSHSGVHAGH